MRNTKKNIKPELETVNELYIFFNDKYEAACDILEAENLSQINHMVFALSRDIYESTAHHLEELYARLQSEHAIARVTRALDGINDVETLEKIAKKINARVSSIRTRQELAHLKETNPEAFEKKIRSLKYAP